MPDHPLLRKLAALSPLSDEDRRLLAQVAAHPVAIPGRTDLIREGDTPRGVFLVLDGMACRYKILPDGARQVLAFLVPGDFSDLDVALLGAMDHAIGTLSSCRVAHIPARTVADLFDNHPAIARALRLAALVEAATVRQWLAHIGRRPCERRLAHILCELLVRLRSVGLVSDAGFDLPLTQVDLADATGMTSVHVNRSLRSLRRRGLIEIRGRRVVIPDLVALKAAAGFDPGYLRHAAADPRPDPGPCLRSAPPGDIVFRKAALPEAGA